MNLLLSLTKSDTFIIGPVANLLGYIMEGIFVFCSWFGIANIGLSIILFTLIVKLLMLPMSIKQQKFSKLNAVMMPEIQAIQKKYKDKKDQESLLKQQAETKAVYEKYGTSPTGGCLQLLIQMPIIFALYRVIYNIPAYVASVKEVYMEIGNALIERVPDYSQVEGFVELAKANITQGSRTLEAGNVNKLVDAMYNFDHSEWNKFTELFPSLTDVVAERLPEIDRMNAFFGINLATAPANNLWPAIIIPILAGLTQWYSTKLMTANTPQREDDPTAKTMNTMNTIMPLVSVFFCFTFASGIGVYWVASSVCQIIIQLIVNKHMEKIDVNQLIEKNLEKVNKKRAKQGLPPQKMTKASVASLHQIEENENARLEKIAKREAQMKKSTEFYNQSSNAKPGSLAAKANMVQKYNETHKK